MQAINQVADKLTVKFCIAKENLDTLKESIAAGSLEDAIRAAKQLAHSANSIAAFLEVLRDEASAKYPKLADQKEVR